MSGLQCLATENIWFDKQRYDEAERHFYEGANGPATQQQQQSSSHSGDQELVSRMKSLELENQTLHKVVEEMRAALQKLETRVGVLEKSPAPAAVPCAKAAPVQSAPVKQVKVENGDDDDDIDLFGSDEEDEEAERLKQELGYGIKKLQINCVVEDDKVGTDILEEEITKFEDYVQSVDVAAFNKI
uniref:Elongation factor 1-delta n=1 Tax=Iconisemion striatum TaxID=60296 RepID=A0A1A7YDN7_9TELE